MSVIQDKPPPYTPDKSTRTPSLSETVFHTIRQKILRGEIPPGEKLKIEVLEREHGLSSSPLREALNRLVAERLVVADNNRGFRAAPISADDMRDITEFRLVVEPMAFGLAIKHGTDEWEGGIVAAYHRFERIRVRLRKEESALNDEWTDRHKEFHMALLSTAPSPRLLTTCSSLFDQVERYRRFSSVKRKQPRNTDSEHQRLSEAAVARDADLAVALLRGHIELTARNFIELLQAN